MAFHKYIQVYIMSRFYLYSIKIYLAELYFKEWYTFFSHLVTVEKVSHAYTTTTTTFMQNIHPPPNKVEDKTFFLRHFIVAHNSLFSTLICFLRTWISTFDSSSILWKLFSSLTILPSSENSLSSSWFNLSIWSSLLATIFACFFFRGELWPENINKKYKCLINSSKKINKRYLCVYFIFLSMIWLRFIIFHHIFVKLPFISGNYNIWFIYWPCPPFPVTI